MTDNREWLDAVDTIDQDTVEDIGPQYPYVQWVNGSAQFKRMGGVPYTGGWFMPAGQIDDELYPKNWTHDELTHADGTATEGWFAQDMTFAFIRYRRAWQVYHEHERRSTLYPWEQYDKAKLEGRQSGKLQVLVVVAGLEDVGPIVLTMKGSTSKRFSFARQGYSVLGQFQAAVLTPANKLARAKGKTGRFPFRAFLMTVGPELNNGQPIFERVGTGEQSSAVTLPCVRGLEQPLTPDALRGLFVGADELERYTQFYTEAEEWANAWKSFDGSQDSATTSASGIPEDAPQDEEEIPF